ncbi:TetR/AcrR family transcriptional regulator [Alterinioella nitratireducens]|uniref:TetR/AcrR family transcriptional regulator n=1 Tax=Alterinioella nitratireducens TaxID=2735915 RepID=UPI001557D858|nr:TetR/AcrR family transcriptional regulator [Alterinioella nitratireducens]NPD20724.1 TetR/AcrR family transcriptional regulator [Alterinioella nitratireducens]|tara:strand:- start:59 stop:655 length:597 start_codon:yes stop_codon:yes gene_type:complete
MARTIAKDHDQKRELILQSAARIFATDGFDRASMAQLARECGISKANIYHYYDSKDALLYDILDNYLSTLRDRILGTNVEGLDPEARLHEVIRQILRAYQGADHEHQVQLNALGALPEDQQAQMRGYQRDMVRFLSDTIAAAAPEVLADDKPKLRATTMSVFGMLNWYYMWNTGAGTEAREDYARLVTNLTLRGVGGL